jgi:acyl-CoA synthetase (AMP-forming)/AMP-acid ligase II
VALRGLHTIGEDDAGPAFIHRGCLFDSAALRADVNALGADLRAQGAQDWALYHDDAYPFTVALLAILATGGRAWLPANATAGTEASLAAYCDGWIGSDWSAGRSIPVGTTGGDGPLPALSGRIVVFTSGSTGEPQPIPKALAQFDREVEALERLWGEGLGDARILATVSHQHIYGLLFRIWWPLSAGRTVYSEPFFEARDLLAAAADERDAAWVASPAHLRRLQEDLPWTTASDRLRMIFSSGGPLPGDAAAECARLSGIWPTEVYGSSESGGIAWRTQADANAWWQPLPNVDVRAADDGALVLRSPHLADGGPLTLSDSIECGADGRFRLGERLDRIVKVEGKRLSLSELESALRGHPWIADARALLLRRRRESIGAAVVPTEAGSAELARQGRHAFTRRVRETLQKRFEPVTLPRLWRFPHALPVNAQGKISEARLRELFEGGGPRRLPHTLSIEGDRASCEAHLRVPDDLGALEGHFPGQPVVPGVALIGWAEHVARHHFAVTGEVHDVERVKFSRPVQPGDELVLRLVRDDVRHCIGYRFGSAGGAEEFASGRLVFADPP